MHPLDASYLPRLAVACGNADAPGLLLEGEPEIRTVLNTLGDFVDDRYCGHVHSSVKSSIETVAVILILNARTWNASHAFFLVASSR
jgi:hypothetical protein